MASIDQQIDEAVVLMKARAADFREQPTEPYPSSIAGPDSILRRAHTEAAWALTLQAHSETTARREAILDTMNLCAVALSLLPKGGAT